MAFDQAGAYMWVFTPGGTGGGTWSYLTRAALFSAVGDQVGNTSCGKYIWTTDGWIFNPKGATASKYVNGRQYYIMGPDGKNYQFGWVPSPITYDPINRNFGRKEGGLDPYNPLHCRRNEFFVVCDNGIIYNR